MDVTFVIDFAVAFQLIRLDEQAEGGSGAEQSRARGVLFVFLSRNEPLRLDRFESICNNDSLPPRLHSTKEWR